MQRCVTSHAACPPDLLGSVLGKAHGRLFRVGPDPAVTGREDGTREGQRCCVCVRARVRAGSLTSLWGQFDGRGGWKNERKRRALARHVRAPLIPLLLIIPPTHFISFSATQIRPCIIPDWSSDILSFIYHTFPPLPPHLPRTLRLPALSMTLLVPPHVCVRCGGGRLP